MRVLVTGGAGWTAAAIRRELEDNGHNVVSLDRKSGERADIVGDVADLSAVLQAIDGVDAVVHLAVAVGAGDYQHPPLPFTTNVLGTYNVFAAARRAGTGRLVVFSSAAVHLPPGPEPASALVGWRSDPGEDHLYDLTKRLQEEIARDFAETFGMNVVVLRVGHIVDSRSGLDPRGRRLQDLEYCRGGWVCRYDVAGAWLRALEAGLDGYNAFHVIGASSARSHFDIARTERVLGFTCRASFGEFDL